MLWIIKLVFSKKFNIILNPDEMVHISSYKIKEEINLLLDKDEVLEKHNSISFVADISEKTANKIKKHPKVAIVEEDKIVRIASIKIGRQRNFTSIYSGNQKNSINFEKEGDLNLLNSGKQRNLTSINFVKQRNTTWSLTRLIKPDVTDPIDYFYEYVTIDSAKNDSSENSSDTNHNSNDDNSNKNDDDSKYSDSNVIVYVLDTGIDVNHPEFEGRAKFGYNNVSGSKNTDENGHGTHCAGIIGSKTFGVAKNVNLIAVKALDKNGVGSISKLIDGVEFISKDVARRKGRFIVNMSVGGEKSPALNYIIKYVSRKYNVHFSSAAGNENKDACKYSPSSSSSFTVGASNENNELALFSNEGKCVDIFAPGTNITSTWKNNNIKTLSGTSMATPHVSGVMAVYLSLTNFEPDELKNTLIRDSSYVIKTGNIEFWSFFENDKKPMISLSKLYDRLKEYNQKIK